MEIAGVMKDFNYNSLHDDIRPFMLRYNPQRDDISHVIVAVGSTDYKTLLSKIETIWRNVLPAVPFEYAFLDDEVQKQYSAEITLSRIINLFTIMAIFIEYKCPLLLFLLDHVCVCAVNAYFRRFG